MADFYHGYLDDMYRTFTCLCMCTFLCCDAILYKVLGMNGNGTLYV